MGKNNQTKTKQTPTTTMKFFNAALLLFAGAQALKLGAYDDAAGTATDGSGTAGTGDDATCPDCAGGSGTVTDDDAADDGTEGPLGAWKKTIDVFANGKLISLANGKTIEIVDGVKKVFDANGEEITTGGCKKDDGSASGEGGASGDDSGTTGQ